MRSTLLRMGCLLAVAAALHGCGGLPSASSDQSAADESAAPLPTRKQAGAAAFERRLRERALVQGRQGRLAEAAASWEILTVLRPDSADYRERLAETRRLIEAEVPERLQRAAQLRKRGELDASAGQYLYALSLQPDHAGAVEALREIERERNKRLYLGKHSRLTLTRRAATEAQMPPLSPPLPLDANEVEHAAHLATQGELDDAIALLERHLALDKGDSTACQLLADMYARKAEKRLSRDRAGPRADTHSSATASASRRARQQSIEESCSLRHGAAREGSATSRASSS